MKNKNKTVWSNRFSKGNSRNFQRIGSSINVDKRLYKEDIFASIIHAQMLVKQRIIPKKDGSKISKGSQILKVYGNTRALLAGERTALNFLGFCLLYTSDAADD